MAVDTISGFHKHVKDIQNKLTNAIAPIIGQLEVPEPMKLSAIDVRFIEIREFGRPVVDYALKSVELSFEIDIKPMKL